MGKEFTENKKFNPIAEILSQGSYRRDLIAGILFSFIFDSFLANPYSLICIIMHIVLYGYPINYSVRRANLA